MASFDRRECTVGVRGEGFSQVPVYRVNFWYEFKFNVGGLATVELCVLGSVLCLPVWGVGVQGDGPLAGRELAELCKAVWVELDGSGLVSVGECDV